MGSFSIWHWLVVLAVILVLFGGGNKISGLMGDFAKGIKSFKKNMAEPDDEFDGGERHQAGRNAAGPGCTGGGDDSRAFDHALRRSHNMAISG